MGQLHIGGQSHYHKHLIQPICRESHEIRRGLATANTTIGGLTITATGQAGTTIRWVATVECAEVAF